MKKQLVKWRHIFIFPHLPYLAMSIIFLFISINSVSAQSLTVKGTVMEIYGTSLPGVSVFIKGQNNKGVGTDANGKYTIVTKATDTLVFSFIGYQTQSIGVTNREQINVTLEPTDTKLSEVVVVGYGTQKKVSLTSAVSTIDKKDLENRPNPSIVNSLQGQVPGLNITQSNAQPGFSQTSINIRGISSLNNNPVLVVIDGVPSTVSLNELNANDIESISVLKDASATSIYGARGSGGVLLITTKLGKNTNGQAVISYDGNFGLQQTTRLPEFVAAPEYVELVNMALQNDNPGSVPRFDTNTIQQYKSGELPSTNWLKLILNKKAYQQQHTLSISGANDKVSYFLSGAINNQDGLMDNVGYQRKNLRSNINTKISDKIEFGINSSYITANRYQPSTTGLRGALGWGYIVPVTEYPYTKSGLPRSFRGGWTPIQPLYGGGLQEYQDNTFSNIITAQYHLIPGLDVKGIYSYVYSTVNESAQYKVITSFFDDGSPAYTAPAAPGLTKSNVVVKNPNLIITTTYVKSFDEHNLKLLGGFSQENQSIEYNSLSRGGFINDQLTQINGGNSDRTLWNVNGRGVEWAINSAFARINYDYKGKYFLEMNGRVDASSRFLNKRVGFFPSLSAGWVLTNENFLKSSTVLNFLKLRASYGSVGNQSALGAGGSFEQQTNQTNSLYPFAPLLATSNYVLNNQQGQTTFYSNIANPDLTWETKTTTNIGIDANLLENRLSATFELYNERTTGIIRQPNVPSTFGTSSPFLNIGTFQNQGYEIALGYNNQVGNLKYSVGINFSDNRNKIVSLGTPSETTGNNPLQEGQSRYIWYGYQAEGLFQSQAEIDNHAKQLNQASLKPGDIKLKDINGDGLVNSSDRVNLGQAQAHYIYALNSKIAYKNFDFSFIFQGVLQNLSVFGSGIQSPFANATGNITTSQLDFWTPKNTDARYPLLRINQNVNYGTLSSWGLYNGAYLRLKNLQIGYTLPQNIAQQIKMKGLRVFLTGENLLTFTAKEFPKDVDPEIGNYVSAGNYPQIRVFSLGLHVDF